MTKKQHYKTSLKKWERILKDIRTKKKYWYLRHYRSDKCGFCQAHPCQDCPLCEQTGVYEDWCSLAARALRLAYDEKWSKAETQAIIFITKIEMEIAEL